MAPIGRPSFAPSGRLLRTASRARLWHWRHARVFHVRPAQALHADHPLVDQLVHARHHRFQLGIRPVACRQRGEIALQGDGFALDVQRDFRRVATGGRARRDRLRPEQPFKRWQTLGRRANALHGLQPGRFRLNRPFSQGRARWREVDLPLGTAREQRPNGHRGKPLPGVGRGLPLQARRLLRLGWRAVRRRTAPSPPPARPAPGVQSRRPVAVSSAGAGPAAHKRGCRPVPPLSPSGSALRPIHRRAG